jgi:predicted HAD superfamily Cof-like phosphohydrolase
MNETDNQKRTYAPNTISRQQFVDSVAAMAGEVWDFHNRFEVGSGQFDGQTPTEIISNRKNILDEEVAELAQAISENEGDESVAGETADVLFVAMGHVEAMGSAGVEGVNRITSKNAAKTNETHAIRPDTGKLLPRKGKPHKWQ